MARAAVDLLHGALSYGCVSHSTCPDPAAIPTAAGTARNSVATGSAVPKPAQTRARLCCCVRVEAAATLRNTIRLRFLIERPLYLETISSRRINSAIQRR